MTNNTIVLATANEHKIKEFHAILSTIKSNIQLLSSVTDFHLDSPAEDGLSFEANAYIKASYVAQNTQYISISDDSGFEVEALDNQPGIFSARWAINGDYSTAFNKIEHSVKDCNNHNARFICVICLCYPNFQHYFFKGQIDGKLCFPPCGDKGFAYDRIFIPNGYTKTFAQMDSQLKNQLSHRYLALSKLQQFIQQHEL